MAILAVLSISDSFTAIWESFAADCGFELVFLSEPARLPRRADLVAIVSGGGVEDGLEPVVRQLGGGGFDVGAVGADADHHLAAALVRAGAAEYFALPADADLLRSWLRDRAARFQWLDDRAAFADAERAKYRFDEILGDSAALRAALDRASRVIPHANVTVLITGETGTGKELIARAIHYNGPRREAAFVEVNCAAIPDQLLESELFGHEKGSFTGAIASKPGLFEVANGGTLFLDEIGHLPVGLQGKLLRALEERVVRRIGGTKGIPVDVRIIAATHADLQAGMRNGQFREDLYYRLNVVSVALPPLRERREDIVPLARHFLARFAEQYALPTPVLDDRTAAALMARDWPGNVRELRNAMERALVLANGSAIVPEDLPPPLAEPPLRPLADIPFPATMRDITRTACTAMLALCGGNKSEAARRLGISRARLMRLLEDRSTPDDEFIEASDA
ncbi:MAG TPA: sigma-54 dependent transcriptional regulator [Gemmatimonadaceae bacterium]|nr:sigma-54 dependent transcriptional regulator [Gemmatimonadaceae bacterium]